MSHPVNAFVTLRSEGVGVVVDLRRIESVEFDRADAFGARHIEPFPAGQQGRGVAGGQESQAQRDGREGVSGVGSGDHGDAHAGYPATASAVRLER